MYKYLFIYFLDGECNPGFIPKKDHANLHFDKTSIVGLVVWMFCVLYSSLRSASKVAQIAIPDPEKQGNFEILIVCTFYSVLFFFFKIQNHDLFCACYFHFKIGICLFKMKFLISPLKHTIISHNLTVNQILFSLFCVCQLSV